MGTQDDSPLIPSSDSNNNLTTEKEDTNNDVLSQDNSDTLRRQIKSKNNDGIDTTTRTRNRWKTVRERDRLKARYDIRQRLQTSYDEITSSLSSLESEKDKNSNNREGEGETPVISKEEDPTTLLKHYLHAISTNSTSSFGVIQLSKHYALLSSPVSTSSLCGYKLKTLGTSRINAYYANCVMTYFQQKESCYLIEYASLLGQHRIVGCMLKGAGLDPTCVGSMKLVASASHDTIENIDAKEKKKKREKEISCAVMKLFVLDNTFPQTLACYIVRKVAEMRVIGLVIAVHCSKSDGKSNHHVTNNDDGNRKENDESLNDKNNYKEVHDSHHCYNNYQRKRKVRWQEEVCPVCLNQQGSLSSSKRCISSIPPLNPSTPLLNFGQPCYHFFCESCLWENILQNINSRVEGNVIHCPICDVESPPPYEKQNSGNHHEDDNNWEILDQNELLTMLESLDEKDKKHMEHENTNAVSCDIYDEKNNGCVTVMTTEGIMSPKEKCKASLQKYESLPATVHELKKRPKKSKAKNILHSTWPTAVYPYIGSSQDVRTDKLYQYTNNNGPLPYITSILHHGVDINYVNEYNQTALYIGCWKGYASLVELLLEYGADMNIMAHGMLSAENVALENGHVDVLDVLLRFRKSNQDLPMKEEEKVLTLRERFHTKSQTDEKIYPPPRLYPKITILIAPASNHPGAGACYIDSLLSEFHLKQLEKLWTYIPPEESKNNEAKKGRPCSVRSYFCDAEKYLCQLLSKSLLHLPSFHLLDDGQDNRTDCSGEGDNNSKEGTEYAKEKDARHYPKKPIFLSHMRFLHYTEAGSVLAPHVDLNRVLDDDEAKLRSTHTFILYLRDCPEGGATALLSDLSDPKIIARVQPRRGRLLLFPHMCPHEGLEVVSVPKLLLRGEVLFI